MRTSTARIARYTLALAAFLFCVLPAAADSVWYVDRDNTSTSQNGRAWSTAFTTIQPALDAAFADGGGEVWIAEGVYDESRNVVASWPYDPSGSLILLSNIDIYGGFAGTETSRDQRDPLHRASVIDASHANNGTSAWTAIGIDNEENITLDGLVVTGASTGFIGGGLSLWSSTAVTIRNCRFLNNQSSECAGINIGHSENITIEKCLFQGNTSSEYASTVSVFKSTVRLLDSAFIGNVCVDRNSNRSTVAIQENGNVDIERCVFRGNFGTPIRAADKEHTIRIVNTDFINNDGDNESGGLAIRMLSDRLTIERCIFSGNTGGDALLGLETFDGDDEHGENLNWNFYIKDSAFINNTGASVAWLFNSNVHFIRCTFAGNSGWDRAHLSVINIWDDPAYNVISTVTDSIVWNEASLWDFYAGAQRPTAQYFYPPMVSNCLVRLGAQEPYNAPVFRDLASGDFRLLPESIGIDAAGAVDEGVADALGTPRPQYVSPDLGAAELPDRIPTLDESTDLILAEFEQMPFVSDLQSDLDSDGLADLAGIGLLSTIAGIYNPQIVAAARNAFGMNLQSIEEESFDAQIQRRKHLIAAWMSVSAAAQSVVRDTLAELGLVLESNYAAVACNDLGECEAAIVSPELRGSTSNSEPYSGPGDFDADGMTNADEWASVAKHGGTLDEFIAAATDPTVKGSTTTKVTGSCFIATAAYGSSLAGQLQPLRQMRDSHLLTNPLGVAFTDVYYRLSPPVAGAVAENSRLRGAVRATLAPLLAVARWLEPTGDE